MLGTQWNQCEDVLDHIRLLLGYITAYSKECLKREEQNLYSCIPRYHAIDKVSQLFKWQHLHLHLYVTAEIPWFSSVVSSFIVAPLEKRCPCLLSQMVTNRLQNLAKMNAKQLCSMILCTCMLCACALIHWLWTSQSINHCLQVSENPAQGITWASSCTPAPNVPNALFYKPWKM